MVDENESVGHFTARTIVVTGANSGIGLAGATALARRAGRLALVGRDRARLDEAVTAVRAAAGPDTEVTGFRADFAVLDEVRTLAAELADAYPRIDVLANNAGLVVPKRSSTVDGHETTIQINHLAPFLLTNLLRDRIAGGRVVNTSSDAHRSGRLDPADLDSATTPYKAFTVYGSSKQANILFAAEAARRWSDIRSYSYHPGVVRTRFGRDSGLIAGFYKITPFLRTPERGADTMLWLADAPVDELTNGGYYVDRELRQPTPRATDPEIAARLWERSAKAVGLD